MQRCWIITSPGGAGVGGEGAAIAALLERAGIVVAERSLYPGHRLPGSDRLRLADVDVVVLMLDDGAVNQVTTQLDGWEGSVLVLPVGDQGQLARHLHGTIPASEVVERAVTRGRRVRLPFLDIGRHRAFVALAVGPSAGWGDTPDPHSQDFRGRLWTRLLYFWWRLFSPSVKLFDGVRKFGRHRAVVLTPSSNGMDVSAIGLSNWIEVSRLGLGWIGEDWQQRSGVTPLDRAAQLIITSGAPIHALFDGERFPLRSPVHVARRTTRLLFLATADE